MSRLNNASRNGMVTLIFFVATTLLSFFSRKVMLDHLGTDLLGLNTALNAIIDFMLLMELGVTSAIAVSLYRPLADSDTRRINEIMWLIKYLYRLLAAGILIVGLLVSPFLPYLVEKSEVTLGQTYVAYFVFLICAAANYNFGYGRVLFQADQRNFVPVTISNVTLLTKTLVQIFVVISTDSYWWWLAIELIFQVLAYFGVQHFLYRQYRTLIPASELTLKVLIRQYGDIFYNAKRIAVHNLAGFVLRQSNNIVIATMINLSTVALYGNYYMINAAVNGLLWNVMQNAWAGVGNLVATETRDKVYAVYKEYLSANFFISMVANFSILLLVEDFVRVWLGAQYVISYDIVIAMFGVNIVGSMTNATTAFVVAYKLFNDVWVPLFEVVVNLVLAVIGAHYFGLIGVIAGTFGSVLISAVWKPIYLHRKGVHLPMGGFVLYVMKMFVLLTVAFLVIYRVCVMPLRSWIGPVEHFGQWVLLAVLVFLSVAIVLSLFLYGGDVNFRMCVRRIRSSVGV